MSTRAWHYEQAKLATLAAVIAEKRREAHTAMMAAETIANEPTAAEEWRLKALALHEVGLDAIARQQFHLRAAVLALD